MKAKKKKKRGYEEAIGFNIEQTFEHSFGKVQRIGITLQGPHIDPN